MRAKSTPQRRGSLWRVMADMGCQIPGAASIPAHYGDLPFKGSDEPPSSSSQLCAASAMLFLTHFPDSAQDPDQ